jgi:hypothetical protein
MRDVCTRRSRHASNGNVEQQGSDAVRPAVTTFAGFSLALGVVLVPAGIFMVQRQTPMFMAMAVYLVPLLAPANQMSYDAQHSITGH